MSMTVAELTDGAYLGVDGRLHPRLSIDEYDEWCAHDVLTADEYEFERKKAGL